MISFGLKLCERRSRGHSLKLQSDQPRVDVRKYYFSNRVVKPWNALPAHVVVAESVNVFKRELYGINLNEFLMIKQP